MQLSTAGIAWAIVISFCFGVSAKANFPNRSAPQYTNVKILVRDDLRGAAVKGVALQFGLDGEMHLAQEAVVYVTVKGLRFTVKDGDSVMHFVGPKLVIDAAELTLDGAAVPSRMTFVPTQGLRMRAIAELDLENYLLGVVPSEMPSRWPLEALKAQAIASRSYAMAIMNSRRNKDYHLESTVMHQVYSYAAWKGLSAADRAKILAAVDGTRGEYLTAGHGTNAPLMAYYHSDCGGRTEDANAVWSTAGVSTGVFDKGCALRGKGEWHFDVRKSEVLREMKNADPALALENISDISVTGRSPSGRIAKILVRDSRLGATKTYELNEFRQLLGFSRLRSGFFEISMGPEFVNFVGRGFGHGVGMCQMGARVLAKAGRNFEQILRHYFTDVELKSLRPTNLVKTVPKAAATASAELPIEELKARSL